MKKQITSTLLVFAVCHVSFASEDIPQPVKQIEFKLDDSNKVLVEKGYPPELVKHPVLLHQQGKSKGTIVGVHLVWNGEKLSVPDRDLKEIPNIQLDSIEVRDGAYYGGVNSNAHYRLISCSFGKPVTRNGDHMEAWFLFWHGKYQELTVRVPVDGRREEGTNLTLIGFFIDRKVGEEFFVQGDEQFESLQEFLNKKKIGLANKAIDSDTK